MGGDFMRRPFFQIMQVVEIEDSLAVKISELAKSENKSLTEYVNLSLRETLSRKTKQRSDEEKLKRFAESFKIFPQQPEENKVWQDEQVWEDE